MTTYIFSQHSTYSTTRFLSRRFRILSQIEAVVRGHLDPGEAQAFALADAHDGRLLTDDGDARSFAKNRV